MPQMVLFMDEIEEKIVNVYRKRYKIKSKHDTVKKMIREFEGLI